MFAVGVPPQAVHHGDGGLETFLFIAVCASLLWVQFREPWASRWRARGRAVLPIVRHIGWDIIEVRDAILHPKRRKQPRLRHDEQREFEALRRQFEGGE